MRDTAGEKAIRFETSLTGRGNQVAEGRIVTSPPVPDRDDPDAVVAGFVAWLAARNPADAPELIGYERPAVGFSSETLLVDIRRAGADVVRDERLVVKLPPRTQGIFPTYDFDLQARVQHAVSAAGIPAAAPVRVERDSRWMGDTFLVMPAVSGHIVSEIPVRDQWLTQIDPELNASVYCHYIDVIAKVHGIDWQEAGLDRAVPVRNNDAELAYWREYLAWYGDGQVLVPALVNALDWCESRRPRSEPPPSLLWGDVRLGNVIFTDERAPAAILDWEMATIGAGEHDLAWTLTLEAIQDELFGRRVPGFLNHDQAVARYEAQVGRPVRDLSWYEIFAMVRSTAVMTRVAHLATRAGQPELFPMADNPILAILQRRIDQA
jgi:aminoglycoside phosphotransferase (APT) family kinase protein